MTLQKIIVAIPFTLFAFMLFCMGVLSAGLAKGCAMAYGIKDPLTFIAWLNPFIISYCCFTFMLLTIWTLVNIFRDPDWKGKWR